MLFYTHAQPVLPSTSLGAIMILVVTSLAGCTPSTVSPSGVNEVNANLIVNEEIHSQSTNTIGENIVAERAVLAGGCFWGMQDLIRKLPGVTTTRVGYTGGNVPNATYRNHGTHAESIEISFDPEKTNYRKLLEFFFQIHDPTTLNRQGNDRGMSYRSAIYYTTEEQKRVATDTIEDVNASGLWPGMVVTEVKPAGDFWEAEPEHQDYLEINSGGYTCHFPRPNWVLPKRSESISN